MLSNSLPFSFPHVKQGSVLKDHDLDRPVRQRPARDRFASGSRHQVQSRGQKWTDSFESRSKDLGTLQTPCGS